MTLRILMRYPRPFMPRELASRKRFNEDNLELNCVDKPVKSQLNPTKGRPDLSDLIVSDPR